MPVIAGIETCLPCGGKLLVLIRLRVRNACPARKLKAHAGLIGYFPVTAGCMACFQKLNTAKADAFQLWVDDRKIEAFGCFD